MPAINLASHGSILIITHATLSAYIQTLEEYRNKEIQRQVYHKIIKIFSSDIEVLHSYGCGQFWEVGKRPYTIR